MESPPELGQTVGTGDTSPKDSSDEVPTTERSNPLSADICSASPEDIALILHACDQEIFAGWNASLGLQNPQIVDKVTKVATAISRVVQNPHEGCVVISGCGTSGRLAYLTTRRFNAYLKSQGKDECFKYIISGGNDALFSSVELAEDDAAEGARRLQEVVVGKSSVVYIGVTCGLSAPFVAGQLDLCLSRPEIFTPVLLGFNTAQRARKTPIEHLNKTFHQVVMEMLEAEGRGKAFVLNPIVGPEPIAGSTRMKSGTSTKIVLEILSFLATANSGLCLSVADLVSMYRAVCQAVYNQAESLGLLIQMAGDSLRSGGHLYYLGRDGVGLMAMIDASECVPTYGAAVDDVQGFVSGGIDDLDSHPISRRLSIEDFEREILPTLEPVDSVIIFEEDLLLTLKPLLFTSPCKRVLVNFMANEITPPSSGDSNDRRSAFDLIINIDLRPALSFLNKFPDSKANKADTALLTQLARESGLKWTVNCASTGAHVLLGKVYRNLMVDVRVSNAKLFYRACAMIADICGLDETESQMCLLRSIYSTDRVSESQWSAPVVEHVLAATSRSKVVPTAILLAMTRCSVKQAWSILEGQPNLSRILKNPEVHGLLGPDPAP